MDHSRTGLPLPMGLAATFDYMLADRYGEHLARATQGTQGTQDTQGTQSTQGTTLVATPPLEHYSADPYLAGVMGKHVSMGIHASGMRAAVGVPAEAAAEAEAAAGDLNTPTMRERHLLPLEIAVREGRVDTVHGAGPQLDRVLREEWGFAGTISSTREPDAEPDAPTADPGGPFPRYMAGRAVTLLRNELGVLPLASTSKMPDIVVLSGGTPPPDAPTVIACFNRGPEAERAVEDVIYGRINPSGKLPVAYPGLPFGHGLTYTSFLLHDATLTHHHRTLTVHTRVTNTGPVAGAEVVQIYAEFAGLAGRRFVGFKRVAVAPGQTAVAEINMDADGANHPFSLWDSAAGWVDAEGPIVLHIGTSSGDTPLTLAAAL